MNVLLSRDFYNRPATEVAPDLLGCRLVCLINGVRVSGIIRETEAYQGIEDLGCHAHVGKTPRNAPMFEAPGHAYVYFTYGMHWMLNTVCEGEGVPAAVLIRAIYPLEGWEILTRNRPRQAGKRGWLDGPAKLAQALGVDKRFNRHDLCSPESELFIERGSSIPSSEIEVTGRIGLGKTPEPWFSIPWRWVAAHEHFEKLNLPSV